MIIICLLLLGFLFLCALSYWNSRYFFERETDLERRVKKNLEELNKKDKE
jgi:hypothetical protein